MILHKLEDLSSTHAKNMKISAIKVVIRLNDINSNLIFCIVFVLTYWCCWRSICDYYQWQIVVVVVVVGSKKLLLIKSYLSFLK